VAAVSQFFHIPQLGLDKIHHSPSIVWRARCRPEGSTEENHQLPEGRSLATARHATKADGTVDALS
jgi:hypothetical protein